MRNPQRAIYVGPRGWSLSVALRAHLRAKDYIPALELAVFTSEDDPAPRTGEAQVTYAYKKLKRELDAMLAKPGVSVFSDRLSYAEMAEEYQKSGIWIYPTHTESDIIAARMAQLHGAIPLYNPLPVVDAEVFAGIPIFGVPAVCPMSIMRYAYELMRLARDPELQEDIRVPMVEKAASMNWGVDSLYRIVHEASQIDGWMAKEELAWLAQVATRMESIAEIGSWKGRSTYALASACKGNVCAIDHWKGSRDEPLLQAEAADGSVFKEFLQNLAHFTNVFAVIESSAAAAQGKLADDTFDMVFIDGGHSYDEVVADLEAWAPKAKHVICGHDYTNWKSIPKAIHDVIGPVQQGPGSLWYKVVSREPLANAAD